VLALPDDRRLGVAQIGYAFMDASRSHAWRTAPRAFALPLTPELRDLVGRDASAVAAAVSRLGWAESDRWARGVERGLSHGGASGGRAGICGRLHLTTAALRRKMDRSTRSIY
jgi:hypothetical protein